MDQVRKREHRDLKADGNESLKDEIILVPEWGIMLMAGHVAGSVGSPVRI